MVLQDTADSVQDAICSGKLSHAVWAEQLVHAFTPVPRLAENSLHLATQCINITDIMQAQEIMGPTGSAAASSCSHRAKSGKKKKKQGSSSANPHHQKVCMSSV